MPVKDLPLLGDFFEMHKDIAREGPRMQTIELARNTSRYIYALDIHKPFIDKLNDLTERWLAYGLKIVVVINYSKGVIHEIWLFNSRP